MANIKSTIGKGVKRYGELISGSGVQKLRNETLMKGDRATKAKDMMKGVLDVAKTKKPGARNSELEKVISLKRAGNKAYGDFNNAYGRYKNELIKSTGARIGTAGALGGGVYGISKAVKGNGEKQASEIVEESFERTAGFKETLTKGAKRYGDLLMGTNLKSKRNSVLSSTNLVNKMNKATNHMKSNVSSTKDFLKYKAADKKLNNAMDHLTKSQRDYTGEFLKITGTRMGTGAAIGAGINYATKDKEKTASEIVEETFDKIAANTTMMADMPDYDKALGDLGVKGYKKSVVDKVVGKVKPEKAPKNEYLDGLTKNYKKNKKHIMPKKNNLEVIKGLAKGKGAKIGAGIVAGTSALAGIGYGVNKMRNNEEKAASEIVEESFDKVAALKFKKAKNVGKTLKNIATGKNIKNAINDIDVASKAGAYKDTLKRLKGDRNKEVAKTVGLHAAGLVGLGGTGYSASKAVKKEKTASEIVEDSFNKAVASGMFEEN